MKEVPRKQIDLAAGKEEGGGERRRRKGERWWQKGTFENYSNKLKSKSPKISAAAAAVL